MKDLKLQVGLKVILSYRRLSYTPWHALAEFIDNAVQSFRDNEKAIRKANRSDPQPLTVSIQYDRNQDVLVIRDNAMGMSHEELVRALDIGRPPDDTNGLSQYGLGMKTAACWFGDLWSVTTKKLHESRGFHVVVDVDKVATDPDHKLKQSSFAAATDDHYTELRIERLHMKLQGRRLGKTKNVLSSMYRVEIRDKRLRIDWDLAPIPWNGSNTGFLKGPDGQEAKVDIDFAVDGRHVRGWVGALAPGFSSRGNAGFALVRRGRLIRGAPSTWRPEAIFGPDPGRNDLINQRVTGEIHLDAFDVSHTKDDIVWRTGEEDAVEDGIKDQAADIIKLARDFRQKEERPREEKLALDAVVENSNLAKLARLAAKGLESLRSNRPPPRVHEVAMDRLFKVASSEEDLVALKLDQATAMRFVATSKSGRSAPYLAISQSKKQILVVVNAAHPFCPPPEEPDTLLFHVKHVLADALAQWSHKNDITLPVELAKDAVLRVLAGEEA